MIIYIFDLITNLTIFIKKALRLRIGFRTGSQDNWSQDNWPSLQIVDNQSIEKE